MASPGRTLRLADIDCGTGMRGRLASMGLMAGTNLSVVSASAAGPLIVAVDSARIVLGRGMACRIRVQETD